jgi:hypothetical protein
LSSLRVKCLPECPHTIYLTVVEIESWITGGCEKISTGVTIDGKVTATMRSDVGREWNTLQFISEVCDVLIGEQKVCTKFVSLET